MHTACGRSQNAHAGAPTHSHMGHEDAVLHFGEVGIPPPELRRVVGVELQHLDACMGRGEGGTE
jgi:hypothetical protein